MTHLKHISRHMCHGPGMSLVFFGQGNSDPMGFIDGNHSPTYSWVEV